MKVSTTNLILGILVGLIGCGAGAFIAIGDYSSAKELLSGFVGTVFGHAVGSTATKSQGGNTK